MSEANSIDGRPVLPRPWGLWSLMVLSWLTLLPLRGLGLVRRGVTWTPRGHLSDVFEAAMCFENILLWTLVEVVGGRALRSREEAFGVHPRPGNPKWSTWSALVLFASCATGSLAWRSALGETGVGAAVAVAVALVWLSTWNLIRERGSRGWPSEWVVAAMAWGSGAVGWCLVLDGMLPPALAVLEWAVLMGVVHLNLLLVAWLLKKLDQERVDEQ